MVHLIVTLLAGSMFGPAQLWKVSQDSRMVQGQGAGVLNTQQSTGLDSRQHHSTHRVRQGNEALLQKPGEIIHNVKLLLSHRSTELLDVETAAVK